MVLAVSLWARDPREANEKTTFLVLISAPLRPPTRENQMSGPGEETPGSDNNVVHFKLNTTSMEPVETIWTWHNHFWVALKENLLKKMWTLVVHVASVSIFSIPTSLINPDAIESTVNYTLQPSKHSSIMIMCTGNVSSKLSCFPAV